MLDDGDEQAGGAVLVLDERFTDTGLVGEVLRSVSEECGESFWPFDGLYEDVGRDGEESFLRSRRDDFVVVVREHGQDFRPVNGVHVSAGCTDGYLPLARGAVMAKLFYNFSAERLHRTPASGPLYQGLFYRMSRVFRAVVSRC